MNCQRATKVSEVSRCEQEYVACTIAVKLGDGHHAGEYFHERD
jgi:hypothetical protein